MLWKERYRNFTTAQTKQNMHTRWQHLSMLWVSKQYIRKSFVIFRSGFRIPVVIFYFPLLISTWMGFFSECTSPYHYTGYIRPDIYTLKKLHSNCCQPTTIIILTLIGLISRMEPTYIASPIAYVSIQLYPDSWIDSIILILPTYFIGS